MVCFFFLVSASVFAWIHGWLTHEILIAFNDLHQRSRWEQNIQDYMEIFKTSVFLSSLLGFLCQGLWLSQALALRTQNTLTKAHPHGPGHTHSAMPRWQMELTQRERERVQQREGHALIGWAAQSRYKLFNKLVRQKSRKWKAAKNLLLLFLSCSWDILWWQVKRNIYIDTVIPICVRRTDMRSRFLFFFQIGVWARYFMLPKFSCSHFNLLILKH